MGLILKLERWLSPESKMGAGSTEEGQRSHPKTPFKIFFHIKIIREFLLYAHETLETLQQALIYSVYEDVGSPETQETAGAAAKTNKAEQQESAPITLQ